jgi:chromate transporter
MAITAAVVGVILNLGVWFGLHVVVDEVRIISPYGLAIDVPVWSTLKLAAAALVLAALIAVSPFRIRPMTVLRVALQLVSRCEWLA